MTNLREWFGLSYGQLFRIAVVSIGAPFEHFWLRYCPKVLFRIGQRNSFYFILEPTDLLFHKKRDLDKHR